MQVNLTKPCPNCKNNVATLARGMIETQLIVLRLSGQLAQIENQLRNKHYEGGKNV